MMEMLGLALLGLVAGFMSGCFGVGGGVVLVPALMLFFATPYHVAVGTSLALILPIALAGGGANMKLGNIDWKIWGACAATGVIGAVLGSMLIQQVHALYAKRAFSIVLIYAAWRLWVK